MVSATSAAAAARQATTYPEGLVQLGGFRVWRSHGTVLYTRVSFRFVCCWLLAKKSGSRLARRMNEPKKKVRKDPSSSMMGTTTTRGGKSRAIKSFPSCPHVRTLLNSSFFGSPQMYATAPMQDAGKVFWTVRSSSFESKITHSDTFYHHNYIQFPATGCTNIRSKLRSLASQGSQHFSHFFL
jgi:hypothetical protein